MQIYVQPFSYYWYYLILQLSFRIFLLSKLHVTLPPMDVWLPQLTQLCMWPSVLFTELMDACTRGLTCTSSSTPRRWPNNYVLPPEDDRMRFTPKHHSIANASSLVARVLWNTLVKGFGEETISRRMAVELICHKCWFQFRSQIFILQLIHPPISVGYHPPMITHQLQETNLLW